MRSKTKPPTKAEKERISTMKEIGCILHRLRGDGWVYCEAHHLLKGNKRRGHLYTVGLSPWFHRGVPYEGMTMRRCEKEYGPSLALNPKEFREVFGDDEWLLEVQNQLIAKWRECNGMATD